MLRKFLKDPNNLDDLQRFAEAQQTTIIALTKKINKLETERNSLKEIVEKQNPSTKTILATTFSPGQIIGDNDQEQICRLEIQKLRNVSLERELTLEECRKLEVYHKILNQIAHATKPKDVTPQLTNEQVTKLLENKDGNDTTNIQ